MTCTCNGPCRMPRWVVDGWFANNPGKQQLAIVRWHMPVTTAEERAAVQRFLAENPALAALTERIRRSIA